MRFCSGQEPRWRIAESNDAKKLIRVVLSEVEGISWKRAWIGAYGI